MNGSHDRILAVAGAGPRRLTEFSKYALSLADRAFRYMINRPRLASAPATPASTLKRSHLRAISAVASSHCAGYTLVELLVVMSVNSVLMAAAAVLLGMLLRTEHQGRHHFDRTSAMTRLAEQLRADVAVAREAAIITVAPDDQTIAAASSVDHLRLEGPGTPTIDYWQDGERVRRAERQDQTVVSREAFKLPDLDKAEFILSTDKLVTVRLSLHEPNGAADAWTIEAPLAKDTRFSTKGDQ